MISVCVHPVHCLPQKFYCVHASPITLDVLLLLLSCQKLLIQRVFLHNGCTQELQTPQYFGLKKYKELSWSGIFPYCMQCISWYSPYFPFQFFGLPRWTVIILNRVSGKRS